MNGCNLQAVTHTIIDHVRSLCSCCLDCLEDVHSSFNFDPLNFSHTSDEHTTAGHTITEREMSNTYREHESTACAIQCAQYIQWDCVYIQYCMCTHTHRHTNIYSYTQVCTHTYSHMHMQLFTHAYAIIHTNTCMQKRHTFYWLTRTWPSEVPWSPSASSPLAPSSSAWSQLEDGPSLARRGSGTGSPQGETQSSANNRPWRVQIQANWTF